MTCSPKKKKKKYCILDSLRTYIFEQRVFTRQMRRIALHTSAQKEKKNKSSEEFSAIILSINQLQLAGLLNKMDGKKRDMLELLNKMDGKKRDSFSRC